MCTLWSDQTLWYTFSHGHSRGAESNGHAAARRPRAYSDDEEQGHSSYYSRHHGHHHDTDDEEEEEGGGLHHRRPHTRSGHSTHTPVPTTAAAAATHGHGRRGSMSMDSAHSSHASSSCCHGGGEGVGRRSRAPSTGSEKGELLSVEGGGRRAAGSYGSLQHAHGHHGHDHHAHGHGHGGQGKGKGGGSRNINLEAAHLHVITDLVQVSWDDGRGSGLARCMMDVVGLSPLTSLGNKEFSSVLHGGCCGWLVVVSRWEVSHVVLFLLDLVGVWSPLTSLSL